MQARIYKRPKNAMQSGKALTDQWILDFVPAEAKKPDPLMGWAGIWREVRRFSTYRKLSA